MACDHIYLPLSACQCGPGRSTTLCSVHGPVHGMSRCILCREAPPELRGGTIHGSWIDDTSSYTWSSTSGESVNYRLSIDYLYDLFYRSS